MKKFLPLILLVLLIPVALAEVQELGTFQKNTCVNLIQTCANCSFVNISSIVYPAPQPVAFTNYAMTKYGTSFNYTFCNTSSIGVYIYNTFGNPDGIVVVQPVQFEITTTGKNTSYVFPIFIFLISFALMIVSFVFKQPILIFISGLGLMVGGVYIMIYGLEVLSNTYTNAIAFISLGLGAIFALGAFWEMIQDWGD